MRLHVILTIASLFMAGAATAQTAPYPGACQADAKKLCGTEAKTRDKAKIQACLAANAAKVTPNCQANLKAAQAAKAAQ